VVDASHWRFGSSSFEPIKLNKPEALMVHLLR